MDSVQKDIARLVKTIQETAAADPSSYNSIVQLAGLTPAKVPDRKEVSGDTQLIMSAIAALEQRLDLADRKNVTPFLSFDGDRVTLPDGDTVTIGDSIFDSNTGVSGTVFGIKPRMGTVLVRDSRGTVHTYLATSPDSRNLESLPF